MKISKTFMDELDEVVYKAMTQQSANTAQALSHAPWSEAKDTPAGMEAKAASVRIMDFLMRAHGKDLFVTVDRANLEVKHLGKLVFVPYETVLP